MVRESDSLHHEMVLKALRRAVKARRPTKGLVIHSDRGIQYCCEGFREKIAEYGLVQSMSRKGNCWDNAVSESLFRSLKTEWAYPIDLDGLKHAEPELFEYIVLRQLVAISHQSGQLPHQPIKRG